MSWNVMFGTLDGVSFSTDAEYDAPIVLVERRSWSYSDMTGRVLLVRLPSWLTRLFGAFA